MKNLLWLTLGFALASSAVCCIYQLGRLNGEIDAITEHEAPTHGQDARGPSDGAAHTGTTGVSPVGAGKEVAR